MWVQYVYVRTYLYTIMYRLRRLFYLFLLVILVGTRKLSRSYLKIKESSSIIYCNSIVWNYFTRFFLYFPVSYSYFALIWWVKRFGKWREMNIRNRIKTVILSERRIRSSIRSSWNTKVMCFDISMHLERKKWKRYTQFSKLNQHRFFPLFSPTFFLSYLLVWCTINICSPVRKMSIYSYLSTKWKLGIFFFFFFSNVLPIPSAFIRY